MLPALYFFDTGCVKEYSFEGGPLPDSLIDTLSHDTVPGEIIQFPVCDLCHPGEELSLGKWNFRYDNFYLCGNITRAIISPDKNGFTFFGPSACSLDTGIVFTVYIDPNVLDRDVENLKARITIFEYYDNVTQKDIFISDVPHSFSLTIDKYVYATGIAVGTFEGFASARDHSQQRIFDGHFQIQFK